MVFITILYCCFFHPILLFETEPEFCRSYVLNLLNPVENYASQCFIDGHKLEFAQKKKYIRILKERGITQLTNFINLSGSFDDIDVDEELSSMDDDEIFSMFHDHDEKFFNRRDLATVLIQALFKKKNSSA